MLKLIVLLASLVVVLAGVPSGFGSMLYIAKS